MPDSIHQHRNSEDPSKWNSHLITAYRKEKSCKTKCIDNNIDPYKERPWHFAYWKFLPKTCLDFFYQVHDQNGYQQ